MGLRRQYEQFASLFKRYRLRSEIESLSELANLLSEEGCLIENSLLSRWQSGDRVPSDRKVFLKIIEIFAQRHGIESVKHANQFLAAANQRDLTEEEQNIFERYLQYRAYETIPEKHDIFIGREEIIKDITWSLLNKKKVLVSGVPGVGKTALAIHIGHILKNRFEDGLFFFRVDVKSVDSIVDELLYGLGYSIAATTQIDYKFSKLTEAAVEKSFGIILDNVEKRHANNSVLHNLLDLPIPVLATSIPPLLAEKLLQRELRSFSKQEFDELSANILGRPFVVQNRNSLHELGKQLGYLPISSIMMLKQVAINPMSLDAYIKQIRQNAFHLKEVSYDNKDLNTSIELCFNNLTDVEKRALISCSLFEGADFSVDAVAHMNELSGKDCKKVLSRLVLFSMAELSLKGRYRLHPVIKIFLINKCTPKLYIAKLVNYYVDKLQKLITNCEYYFGYETENIIGLIKILSDHQMYSDLITIWSSIKMHLWYLGKWNYIVALKALIIPAYKYLQDDRGLILYMSEDLCRIYFYTNNRKQEQYYLTAALKRAELLKDKIIMGLVQQKYGFINLDRGKLQQAKEKLEQSIILLNLKGPKRDLIKSYIYLGKTFTKLGSFDKARICLHHALKKSITHKIMEDIGLSHVFLGDLYADVKKYSDAEKHYQHGIKIEKTIGRKVVIALGYQGIANVGKELGNKTSAISYYEKALKIFNELTMKKEAQLISKELKKLYIVEQGEQAYLYKS